LYREHAVAFIDGGDWMLMNNIHESSDLKSHQLPEENVLCVVGVCTDVCLYMGKCEIFLTQYLIVVCGCSSTLDFAQGVIIRAGLLPYLTHYQESCVMMRTQTFWGWWVVGGVVDRKLFF